MKTVKLQPHFDRINDNFCLTIKKGSKEESHFRDNADDIEKLAIKKTGVEISYNYQNDIWDIPVENQYDF